MERLILEYVHGDGFTYSCTNTVPIVYSSKEDALADLENILLSHQIAEEAFRKELESHSTQIDEVRQKLIKLEGKKGKEKEIKKALDEFKDIQEGYCNIREFIASEFKFGGNIFQYSHFFYTDSDGRQQIDAPNIYTLDEFFQSVSEPSLLNQPYGS